MNARTRHLHGFSSIRLATVTIEAQDLEEFDVTESGSVVIRVEHMQDVVAVTLRRGQDLSEHIWRKTDWIGIIGR